MKNRQYWAKRKKVLEEASNAYSVKTYNEALKGFNKAQAEIEKEIEAWYARIAKNNDISLSEARKLLSADELEEFHWDVKEYIKRGKENALDGKWIKQLENASAKVHISRLEALKVRTQQALETCFGNETDLIDDMARRVYSENYYHLMFEFQKSAGIGFEIGEINQKMLDEVVKKPWTPDGSNFSDRIWSNKKQLVNDVHTLLTQTVIRGGKPDEAIRAIEKKFATTKSNAARLIQTEQAYFHAESDKKAYGDLGIKEFEVIATLDDKTSEICQDMDGEHFPMSAYEIAVTVPPFHPRCRSTTAPYYDDWEEYGITVTRAARDVNGKEIKVPGNMTYKEWKSNFVKSAPIDNIRTPVDVEFNTKISGYKGITGGCSVRSGGEKYGQETKIVSINKRNTTEWTELPNEVQTQLQYTSVGRKPFHLNKGDYEVQRYVEGSFENAERDEIAKSLGADYIGFAFQNKNGYPFFVDFYQKGNNVFYSIGKAQVNKTIKDSSLEMIEKIATEREKLIIENIGEDVVKELSVRSGDGWVSAMKEFHRSIQADGLPTILTDAEYDAIKSPALYRGIAPQSRLRNDITTKSTTKEMADEFFKGQSPFPSRGVYGDGVAYASPAYHEIALNYATNSGKQMHGGVIIEFKLKEDAKVITYEDALELFRKMSQKGNSKLIFNPRQQKAANKEVGKAMNSLGYDAIIKHNGDNTGHDFYVILNRAALVTKKKYITKKL